jgi:hypothetical protein
LKQKGGSVSECDCLPRTPRSIFFFNVHPFPFSLSSSCLSVTAILSHTPRSVFSSNVHSAPFSLSFSFPFSFTELQGCRIFHDVRLDFSGPAQLEIARDNITVSGRQRKASGNPPGEAALNPSISFGPHVAIASAPPLLFFLALCPCLSHLLHVFFYSCGLRRDPFLVLGDAIPFPIRVTFMVCTPEEICR